MNYTLAADLAQGVPPMRTFIALFLFAFVVGSELPPIWDDVLAADPAEVAVAPACPVEGDAPLVGPRSAAANPWRE